MKQKPTTPEEWRDFLAGTVFSGRLRSFGNEKKLQQQITEALIAAGLVFQAERNLGDLGRIDFQIEDLERRPSERRWIALEVKVKKVSRTAVFRQVGGYLDTGKFFVGIILTTKPIEPVLTHWRMEDGSRIPILMINTWMDCL